MPRFAAAHACAALLLTLVAAVPLPADELVLKSGLRLEGDLVPVKGLTADLIRKSQGNTAHFPIWMVHTGLQRVFVPNRQIAESRQVALLSRWETFTLPPHKHTSRQQMFAQIGAPAEVTEFDEYGRRRITLVTPNGPEHVIQGIREINPHYATLEGLSHQWESALATSAFRPEVLDAILRKTTDPADPEDRMAIARFYIQAGMYLPASAELESIQRDFPDLKDRVDETQLTLRTALARQLLAEIRRRMGSGQYELAWLAVKQFPTANMGAAALRELAEIERELLARRDARERVLLRLSDLQGELSQMEQIEAVGPLRAHLHERLDFESLERLEAFLQLEGDATLLPEQRLAVAYSGWLLGSANAITDLDLTLRLWQAQFLVSEYLRNEESARRESILEELRRLEGVGFERIVQMVLYLPAILETPNVRPGVPSELEAPGATRADPPVKYTVLLPPEYTPHHAYPLIVALRPAEVTVDGMIEWWGGTSEQPGQSQRHGYIVIAPEYADLKDGNYDYSVTAHTAVLSALRDARRRFRVDSDRIFLAGHGAGGDAACDIGLSHPDLFAGVVAVNGLLDKYCQWYWNNGKHLPFYLVGGELARSSLANQNHASTLNRMMQYGFDATYVEYVGRGYESYYAELPRLFEWMALQRRAPLPVEVEAKVLRPTDDRFYWLTIEGITTAALQSDVFSERGKVEPMTLEGGVRAGHEDYTAIYLKSGARQTTLWLSPDLVSFEKRLIVSAGGSRKFNGFPEPKVDVLLEDLRLRADRERLVWDKAVIE